VSTVPRHGETQRNRASIIRIDRLLAELESEIQTLRAVGTILPANSLEPQLHRLSRRVTGLKVNARLLPGRKRAPHTSLAQVNNLIRRIIASPSFFIRDDRDAALCRGGNTGGTRDSARLEERMSAYVSSTRHVFPVRS